MHRFISLALRIALPGLLLTACLEPEAPVPPDKVWYGLLSDACGDKSEYRLEVERMDATHVQASFRINTVTKGKTTLRTGTVVLTKCRERPNCG